MDAVDRAGITAYRGSMSTQPAQQLILGVRQQDGQLQPAAPQRRPLPPRLLNGGLMNDHPTPLGGTCSARFDPLRELFAAKLESGEDLGASVAVNIDGEMVVDLWGGWADEARTAPWTENTIANVFSTTKTMTALAALVLVERGHRLGGGEDIGDGRARRAGASRSRRA